MVLSIPVCNLFCELGVDVHSALGHDVRFYFGGSVLCCGCDLVLL